MSSIEEFEHLRIPLQAIKFATNDFHHDNYISGGGFGKVYKGEFVHFGGHVMIAVKRLDARSIQGTAEFWKEVMMLSRYQHPNLVSLLGFCYEGVENILVYEYLSNKSLDMYIDSTTLSWIQRLNICIGAARGLEYLHNPGGTTQRVLHRDIKSANILLDENWSAKISDFGFSKFGPANQEFTFLISNVAGTPGYCDPLYMEKGLLTKESDIYSFGVVLFEVLSGRFCFKKYDDGRPFLKKLAQSCYEEKQMGTIVHSCLKDQISQDCLDKFSTVAYQCLREHRTERPSIAEVLEQLEVVLGDQVKYDIEKEKKLKSHSEAEEYIQPLFKEELKAYDSEDSKMPLLVAIKGLRNNMSSSPKEFAHLQIPLQHIVAATNRFAHENLIERSGFGYVYKGRIMGSGKMINIVARRLDSMHENGDVEFWKEISMLSRLKHENIVSMVGFCDEDGEKIIINKYEVNTSLDKYLHDPTLTWEQRLRICVDAARALSYIHHDTGRDYSVIHCNIRSSKILLDENWKAKVSGFGHSITTPTTLRHRFVLSPPVDHLSGYTDPVHLESGRVTPKSDVYSFGVVMFEVLYGRKAVVRDVYGRLQYLAPLATQHFEDGELNDSIDPNLRKQMDPKSFTIFSDTAYYCLKRQRTKRPHIETVVKRLEQALELQEKYGSPEPLINPLKGKNLEHLKIQLKDIVLATNNFADNCRIGSGAYGVVYKANLEHFDGKNSTVKKGKNEYILPMKRSDVAIKRIFSRQDGQGEEGFIAEIEMLTRCQHQNIVSLLGFCDEGPQQQILVYEFASNGSLEDYLGNTGNLITLTWTQRIKICLGVAQGLNYLHTTMDDKEKIIHRDIKSANILLFENWETKITDFGLSRFNPGSTINTYHVAGTQVYLDPEYLMTGKLKKESDTYSFGVVLFEIFCGRLAYDRIYETDADKGLPSIVRRRFSEGRLKEMIDPKMNEESDNSFTLSRGPNKDSLDTFSKIAYQCLAETQAKRPAMEVVIKELEKALYLQENDKGKVGISLEGIKLATKNFNDDNCIGRGGFGKVYKGEVLHADGHNTIVAKRLDSHTSCQGENEFFTELDILFEYKHEKLVDLVGYCNENGEKIIVYEYASKGSLDRHLNNDGLTWMKRIEICIDVARGLEFLHETVEKQEVVIHRDIKSGNILLKGDWKAKITDFGISLICPVNQETVLIDNVAGTIGYCDPRYMESGVVTKESDIFSFGVLLFEVLCGRLAIERYDVRGQFLYALAKDKIENGKLEDMVFEGIREIIGPISLTIYSRIAYQCVHHEREKRPTASEVRVQLEKALEFQEDYEIWEPKLPAEYKQIIEMSVSPESYSHRMKKDLYTIFSNGILLQEGKVWFSLGSKGERNEMISARKFSYKNRASHKWRCVPESRFKKVAELLDISNLKIQIKIRTHFLSPCVNYGAHLVFRFYGPRKSLAKQMYVNLKYKKGNETLHAYFATWREDGWMMIELSRFYNHKEDTDFEVLLESFSQCYCGSRTVYIEGIEFLPIDNEKHEEIEKSNEGQVLKPSSPSDYEGVVELLRQQVFHIKRKIKSQILSPNKENVCYLVFKISEKCHGLHGPVIVRDLLHWRNKKVGILYFRSPNPWNLHDTDWVPKKREDGWMEVIVWKFNSDYELKDDCLFVNLKLISYEGTMAGLIVRDIELRSM